MDTSREQKIICSVYGHGRQSRSLASPVLALPGRRKRRKSQGRFKKRLSKEKPVVSLYMRVRMTKHMHGQTCKLVAVPNRRFQASSTRPLLLLSCRGRRVSFAIVSRPLLLHCSRSSDENTRCYPFYKSYQYILHCSKNNYSGLWYFYFAGPLFITKV